MESIDLAVTQMEIAYLNSKLIALHGEDLKTEILSNWLKLDKVQVNELVEYCGGIRYPAAQAAFIYQALGFTYVEIGRLIGKSVPTIVNYLRRSQPIILMSAENTPFSEERWKHIRQELNTVKNNHVMFGLTAKESII